MLTNVTKHWKTTAAGIALAAGGAVLNGRTWPSLVIAILTAILGALSKDPSSTH